MGRPPHDTQTTRNGGEWVDGVLNEVAGYAPDVLELVFESIPGIGTIISLTENAVNIANIPFELDEKARKKNVLDNLGNNLDISAIGNAFRMRGSYVVYEGPKFDSMLGIGYSNSYHDNAINNASLAPTHAAQQIINDVNELLPDEYKFEMSDLVADPQGIWETITRELSIPELDEVLNVDIFIKE